MLDVQRADDADACGQQIFHVFIAFLRLAAGSIRVREFIHQRDGRSARDDCRRVHLAQLDPAVLGDNLRHDLQFADLGRGFWPGMWFDVADHDIHPAFFQPVSFREHLEGLPHAGAGSEVDFELALLLLVNERQEIFRLAARRFTSVRWRVGDHLDAQPRERTPSHGCVDVAESSQRCASSRLFFTLV